MPASQAVTSQLATVTQQQQQQLQDTTDGHSVELELVVEPQPKRSEQGKGYALVSTGIRYHNHKTLKLARSLTVMAIWTSH